MPTAEHADLSGEVGPWVTEAGWRRSDCGPREQERSVRGSDPLIDRPGDGIVVNQQPVTADEIRVAAVDD